MGNDIGDRGVGSVGDPPGRRDFLRKAAVAGATAFAVPMIATVDPAHAQAVTSPPPEPPGPGPTTPGTVNPAAGTPGTPPGSDMSPAGRSGRRGQLPRTGANLDRLVAAGLAATAGGAALVLWSADRRANLVPAAGGAPGVDTAPLADTPPLPEAALLTETAPVVDAAPAVEAVPVVDAVPAVEADPAVGAAVEPPEPPDPEAAT
jgi:hypothetical protein